MGVQEDQLINAGVEVGLIHPQALQQIKLTARRRGLDVLEVLGHTEGFPLSALYLALARLKKIPYMDGNDVIVDDKLLQGFNADQLLRRLFMPVAVDKELYVLVTDPDDRSGVESVQRVLGTRPKVALADPAFIESTLRRFFNQAETQVSAVSLFDDILKEASVHKATDLHFEPTEKGMNIRLRVDGQMQNYSRFINKEMSESLISRVKVLAGLDISEQNMAQDGGFAHLIEGTEAGDEIEMRVATIPTRWGERVTLRILGQGTADLTLGQLGMAPAILNPVRDAVRKPHGILLVTGPTGSGKSTTLYAALRELDAKEVNILTVEDPIEQVIEGIGQVQVSEKVSFSKALRSFLRHDPDVMLVGEIRDFETAETAIRAAMTGHMVLSTLHTNSAVSTISRLVDIGCAPFLIASTLEGVLAQRLLRRICTTCKHERPATTKEQKLLKLPNNSMLSEGKGCAVCLGSGFKGRVGIYETLWLNKTLTQMIRQSADDDAIEQQAREDGLLKTLWEDACEKILAGTTTLQEAMPLYSQEV